MTMNNLVAAYKVAFENQDTLLVSFIIGQLARLWEVPMSVACKMAGAL